MNRFPAIRSALFATVIGLAGACCPPDDDIERRETIDDKEFEAELTACLADDLECRELCRAVIVDRGFEGDPEFDMPTVTRCIVTTISPTSFELDMTYHIPYECVGGRLPSQHGPRCAPADASAVARWLADLAHLEASAVVAFVELARELSSHGAPEHLVRRALASAVDERRHAGIAARLARAHGIAPRVPAMNLAPPRSLFEVALTNASEGCVRELYGAAVALYQSGAAAAPYRDAFAEIARDELRHAELSFDIHAWACSRLSPAQRTEVNAARVRAAAALVAEIDSPARRVDPVLSSVLGLPPTDDARALAAQVASASLRQRGAARG